MILPPTAHNHSMSASLKRRELVPQYFVELESNSGFSGGDNSTKSDKEQAGNDACQNLFPLPLVKSCPCKTRQGGEPLIDYLQSILMTSDNYIQAMTTKVARKEVVAKEQEERKVQAEQRKVEREQQKAQKEAEKLMRRFQAE